MKTTTIPGHAVVKYPASKLEDLKEIINRYGNLQLFADNTKLNVRTIKGIAASGQGRKECVDRLFAYHKLYAKQQTA